jgi:hypothetical protein
MAIRNRSRTERARALESLGGSALRAEKLESRAPRVRLLRGSALTDVLSRLSRSDEGLVDP